MKKIIALLLILAVILTCTTVVIAAEPNGVISTEMSAEMEKMQDNDTIATWIEYNYTPYTDEEVISLTEQQCGFSENEIESLEQKHLYYNTLWAVIKSFRLEYAANLLEKMGISEDQIIGGWNKDYGEMPNKYNLSKAQILKAAEIEEVTLIDLYKNQDITETQPPTIAPTEGNSYVRERLVAFIAENYPYAYYKILRYEELYTHIDADNNTDWVLLSAQIDYPTPNYSMGIIGNRVIVSGLFPVFKFKMGLYDAKEDTFYDLSNVTDYGKYNGLSKAIDAYGYGKLLGDIDGDDEITILDATLQRRCEADIMDYPESDWITDSEYISEIYNPIHYYSDFNRDGDRDIIDATCIQRYLVGMDYSIG